MLCGVACSALFGETSFATPELSIGENLLGNTIEGKVARCNKSMTSLLGKPFSEILDHTCYNLMHGTSEPIEECPMVRMLETHHRETLVLQMDDRWFHVAGDPLLDDTGNLIGGVHIMSDITERKRAEEQLRQNAFYDALTGLPNRVVFTDRLGRSIERSKRRRDYLFAVLFLDLDDFKIVNDSLGHMVGDGLLVAVARRLEAVLCSADTVARFGGDEFAMLLDDIKDVNDAILVANRIQKELTLPFNLSGR